MFKKYVTSPFKASLKFLIVDSVVNIVGDLFEQPLVMWAFIGLGWLSIWVMVFSMVDQASKLAL